MAVTIRTATPNDADTMARLHLVSWRSAYRGILSDDYLAGAEPERLAFWQARMQAWNPARSFAAIAEDAGVPIGFVCVMVDSDPQHGALLDNLHMHPDRKGNGIGRQLLIAAGKWVATAHPGTAMFLTVFSANQSAIGFYQRMGGAQSKPFEYRAADGSPHPILRFVWPEPAKIA